MENEFNLVSRINRVIDVLPMQKIFKIAEFPSCFVGVISWQETTLPVANLQLIMEKPATEITEETCILVLELLFDGENIQVGVLVNSTKEISFLKTELIYLPTNFMHMYKSVFIAYYSRFEKKFNQFCFG